jgi:hypothetical protein
MVALTQELTETVKTAFWNAHLILPHTRFSAGWRKVVTCALLSELVRLYTSWKLSGTFENRYTDMTRQLLVKCEQKSKLIRSWIGKHLFFDTTRPTNYWIPWIRRVPRKWTAPLPTLRYLLCTQPDQMDCPLDGERTVLDGLVGRIFVTLGDITERSSLDLVC